MRYFCCWPGKCNEATNWMKQSEWCSSRSKGTKEGTMKLKELKVAETEGKGGVRQLYSIQYWAYKILRWPFRPISTESLNTKTIQQSSPRKCRWRIPIRFESVFFHVVGLTRNKLYLSQSGRWKWEIGAFIIAELTVSNPVPLVCLNNVMNGTRSLDKIITIILIIAQLRPCGRLTPTVVHSSHELSRSLSKGMCMVST